MTETLVTMLKNYIDMCYQSQEEQENIISEDIN